MVKAHVARGEWARAAEMFGDYWGGSGTWAATGPERRAAFIDALKPNMHEWDGVMFDTTPLSTWAEQLPARTLIVYDPATKRPIREIVEIMAAVPAWQTRTIPHGGHMAPLTQPAIVNPIVAEFLAGIVE